MARYYEENALIEFVKQYTPTIEGETTLECVERAIRNAPTADVVPKSEVALKVIHQVKNKVRKYKQNVVNPYEHIILYLNELEKKYTEDK